MKICFGILAMLAICTALASATNVDLHVFTTTTNATQTIYIQVNSGSIITCGTGNVASCNFSVTTSVNSSCNQTLLTSIFNKISSVNTSIQAVNTGLAKVNTSISALPTVTQVTNLFDREQGQFGDVISTQIQQKIAPFLTSTDLITQLKLNLSACEGDKNNCNTRIGDGTTSGLQYEVTSAKNELNDRTNMCLILLIALGFVIAAHFQMVPWLKRKTPG